MSRRISISAGSMRLVASRIATVGSLARDMAGPSCGAADIMLGAARCHKLKSAHPRSGSPQRLGRGRRQTPGHFFAHDYALPARARGAAHCLFDPLGLDQHPRTTARAQAVAPWIPIGFTDDLCEQRAPGEGERQIPHRRRLRPGEMIRPAGRAGQCIGLPCPYSFTGRRRQLTIVRRRSGSSMRLNRSEAMGCEYLLRRPDGHLRKDRRPPGRRTPGARDR